MEMNVRGPFEQNRIHLQMYNKGDKSLIYFFCYAYLSSCLYILRSTLTPIIFSHMNFFFR
jgi:hypothetical protein